MDNSMNAVASSSFVGSYRNTASCNYTQKDEEPSWQSLITKTTRGKLIFLAFEQNSSTKKNDLANFIIDVELDKDPDKR